MMFSFVQENIVANFLEFKDIDVATKAVKDIKGPRYVAGCVFNNLMPFEKECVFLFWNLQGLNQEQLNFTFYLCLHCLQVKF